MELCPICLKREADKWDHDHATGIVRGRLCSNCNAGIGFLGEDPEAFERATLYLARDPDGRLFADIKRAYQRRKTAEWRKKPENAEKDRQRRLKLWAEQPERMREYQRQYRAKDTDGRRARAAVEWRRIWLAQHPEKLATYNERRRKKYHENMKDPAVRAAESARNRERYRARRDKVVNSSP